MDTFFLANVYIVSCIWRVAGASMLNDSLEDENDVPNRELTQKTDPYSK